MNIKYEINKRLLKEKKNAVQYSHKIIKIECCHKVYKKEN